jgi:hypothetical protein
MKVASFVVGLVNGFKPAYRKLDEDVLRLGDIRIHSLTDTAYLGKDAVCISGPEETPVPKLVRVVVYE